MLTAAADHWGTRRHGPGVLSSTKNTETSKLRTALAKLINNHL